MEDQPGARPALFAEDDDPAMGANRVWFNMLRIHRSTGARIARALREIGVGDPLWYEILLELERAGPGGMAMSELERRLFTPQYALSRHVARLEAAGWVASAAAGGPGRGKLLRLTEAGTGMHGRIWTVYREAIAKEIGSRLSVDEAYALARLLIRLYG